MKKSKGLKAVETYKPVRGEIPPERPREPNATIELARKAVEAYDDGHPVPILIAVIDGNLETKSYFGMSANDAAAAGLRVANWASSIEPSGKMAATPN